MIVTIERILPGGLGLAHADGKTLLVSLAAPGDLVQVKIDRKQGKVAFASIVEIVQPSPVRVAPPCRYFGDCGGCDFQQLNYAAQLEAKAGIIRDCLRRIAKIEPPDIPVTSAPHIWGYRTRAEWQRDGRKLGYFSRRSHRVCDVSECAVLAPPLQKTLARLRTRLPELPAHLDEFHASAGLGGISLAPLQPDEIQVQVGNHRYRLNANGFFQSSQALLAPLVAYALKDAQGTTALDLYCGVGLFTLPLAERFAQVAGVEANLAAVEYAQANLIGAGYLHAGAIHAQVADWLTENAADWHGADFLLLDPPRTGVEEGGLTGLLRLAPERLVYVSCDPATLARDLRVLLGNGYLLEGLAAFDFFPQTHHVETVAHLRRVL